MATGEQIMQCPRVCTNIGAFIKARNTSQNAEERRNFFQNDPDQQVTSIALSNNENLPEFKPGPTGIVDWTPLGNMTGARPVVNKSTVNRYSIAEWRKHNEGVLDEELITESNIVDYNAQTAMMQGFGIVDKQQTQNNNKLKQKAKDIFRWKAEVERACRAITEEVELLEIERQRLKTAKQVLMLPDSISKECFNLRSKRSDFELVSDLTEHELVKEINIVSEVTDNMKKTIDRIEEQMVVNKAAKHRIEYDWCDKTLAYEADSLNLSLKSKSNNIMFRQAATKFGEATATPAYWEFFCRETIQDCEATRQQSADLRGSLNSILIEGGRKLRNQADRTDLALAQSVTKTQELCTKLEGNLRSTLQKLVDMEVLAANLKASIRKMDNAMKLAQTRIDNRNMFRKHGERIRDQPQMGLMDEVKIIHETVTALRGQLENTVRLQEELLKKRISLEKDIAAKRKNLTIDRERCGMVRSHFPSALELAGY